MFKVLVGFFEKFICFSKPFVKFFNRVIKIIISRTYESVGRNSATIGYIALFKFS